MSITRTTSKAAAVIAAGAALSNALNFNDFAGGAVITPAAWTSAGLGFVVCDTPDGTFVPLRDQIGNLVEITGIQTSAAAAYPLPDDLFPHLFFKLWSQNSGADANQAGARSLTVIFKC